MKNDKALQTQLDSHRRKVDVDNFDITLRELVNMAINKELIRAPEYQRQFRWKAQEQSALIESFFLGLPVPSIFVATNKDATWELVDGLQRISTLIHFMGSHDEVRNELGHNSPLQLAGLQKLSDFNGLTFSELPTPLQLALQRRPLRVTALSDKSDKAIRFDMFERLNRGGINLTAQEVRSCIYRGPFNNLIMKLADMDDYKSVIKLQTGKMNDGTREEVVLKFFAYLYDRESFKGNVAEFLNDFMESMKPDAFNADDLEYLFKKSVLYLKKATGGKPLLRKKYSVSPLNQLEAVLVGIGELVYEEKRVRKPSGDWQNDAELIKYSTKGTNTPSMLKGRITRSKQLFSGAKASAKNT